MPVACPEKAHGKALAAAVGHPVRVDDDHARYLTGRDTRAEGGGGAEGGLGIRVLGLPMTMPATSRGETRALRGGGRGAAERGLGIRILGLSTYGGKTRAIHVVVCGHNDTLKTSYPKHERVISLPHHKNMRGS